jgi:hypothetical protein
MNHNNHIQCTKDMSQACINNTKTWTSTICNHIPKGPPRHALSMCHTIHDTSLNQTYKRHTFIHEEDLVHIISYQQTNLVHIIFNKQEIPSSSNPFHRSMTFSSTTRGYHAFIHYNPHVSALLNCNPWITSKTRVITFFATPRLSPSTFLCNLRLATSDSTSDSPIDQNFFTR